MTQNTPFLGDEEKIGSSDHVVFPSKNILLFFGLRKKNDIVLLTHFFYNISFIKKVDNDKINVLNIMFLFIIIVT